MGNPQWFPFLNTNENTTMNLQRRFEKEREGLVSYIMDMEDIASQVEPDTLNFVQSFWSEGNMIFDDFREGRMDWVYKRLMIGRWDNKHLSDLYDELLQFKKLMSEIA